jgi:hypothetical protein
MAKIYVTDDTLVATGDIGYEQAGEFARLCDRFVEKRASRAAVIDLTGVGELVSPCLACVYEDCQLHRPAELKVKVPQRLAQLFEPGQAEGLFQLEVI